MSFVLQVNFTSSWCLLIASFDRTISVSFAMRIKIAAKNKFKCDFHWLFQSYFIDTFKQLHCQASFCDMKWPEKINTINKWHNNSVDTKNYDAFELTWQNTINTLDEWMTWW